VGIFILGASIGAVSRAERQDNEKAEPSQNYVCNYAKVYHLKHGTRLSVRSGAGSRFHKVDSLSEGTFVYICDEHGDWVEVFYGSDTTCGSEISSGIRRSKTSGCRSGWVNRQWIDVLSG
jgi:uncharacterized protein YgiM (DUF1202 family)